MSLAVYPWELSLHTAGNGAGCNGMNAITAPISALMPEEGHVRARVGSLTVESSREELDRLGLGRGSVACACFAPRHARLLALKAE